ncbi:MAG TPA: hypothetical protein EYO58_02260 [Flavobacteriales bacterium]|nr:hypothetical protein [Flavobacteriales bacterium]
MEHLPSLILGISLVLSIISVILPQWINISGKIETRHAKIDLGLWEACLSTEQDSNRCCSNYSPYSDGKQPQPKDTIITQIGSICGSVAIIAAILLCLRGDRKASKLSMGLGLIAMLVVLIVYPLISLNDADKQQYALDSNKTSLGVSYWLQVISAVFLLLVLVLSIVKKGKKGKK